MIKLMKYSFIIFVVASIFLNFYSFAQQQESITCADIFKYSTKIAKGETSILYTDFSDLELGFLNKDELRLLRNMVYANHGYKFKSSDLQNYFKNFAWYKPLYDNIDSFMTDLDKRNIDKIRFFESFKETAINLSGINLNGLWQDIPIMASGWSDVFYFFDNNSICFYFSQMDNDNNIKRLLGTYKIQDSFLCINFKSIILNNASIFDCSFNLKLPLYNYERNKEIVAGLHKTKISIGTKNYYYFEGNYE